MREHGTSFPLPNTVRSHPFYLILTMELILGFVVVTVGLVATWRVQQSSRPVRVPLATTTRRSRRS